MELAADLVTSFRPPKKVTIVLPEDVLAPELRSSTLNVPYLLT